MMVLETVLWGILPKVLVYGGVALVLSVLVGIALGKLLHWAHLTETWDEEPEQPPLHLCGLCGKPKRRHTGGGYCPLPVDVLSWDEIERGRLYFLTGCGRWATTARVWGPVWRYTVATSPIGPMTHAYVPRLLDYGWRFGWRRTARAAAAAVRGGPRHQQRKAA